MPQTFQRPSIRPAEAIELVCDGCGKAERPPVYVTPEFPCCLAPASFNWWRLPPGWFVSGSREHDEPEVYACSVECADKADERRSRKDRPQDWQAKEPGGREDQLDLRPFGLVPHLAGNTGQWSLGAIVRGIVHSSTMPRAYKNPMSATLEAGCLCEVCHEVRAFLARLASSWPRLPQ